MTVRFVDTNVLPYAVSGDVGEKNTRERADEILTDRDLALSAQVLQEFYVPATRKSRPDPLTHDQAAGPVASFTRFTVAEITTELVLASLASHDRCGISYGDAAILEAARSLGC